MYPLVFKSMQRCFKQSQSLSDRPWSPLHPQRQTSPTSAFSLHISRERSRSSILLPFNPSGRKARTQAHCLNCAYPMCPFKPSYGDVKTVLSCQVTTSQKDVSHLKAVSISQKEMTCLTLHRRYSAMQYHQTVAAAKEAKSAESVVPVTDLAKRALNCAANSTRQIGWFSFWTQLALSIVSAVILLFSVAFTSQVLSLNPLQVLS